MDKLRVLHKMASERASSAKIFKAIADPPTTSLQRLKVLFFFVILDGMFIVIYLNLQILTFSFHYYLRTSDGLLTSS